MIKEKTLVDKSYIVEFINKKVATLATKAELKEEQHKISKLQASNSSCFHDKSHFEDDGTQNCLVFQQIYRCFEKISSTEHISKWKSK